jgi:hypothetical protein
MKDAALNATTSAINATASAFDLTLQNLASFSKTVDHFSLVFTTADNNDNNYYELFRTNFYYQLQGAPFSSTNYYSLSSQ